MNTGRIAGANFWLEKAMSQMQRIDKELQQCAGIRWQDVWPWRDHLRHHIVATQIVDFNSGSRRSASQLADKRWSDNPIHSDSVLKEREFR